MPELIQSRRGHLTIRATLIALNIVALLCCLGGLWWTWSKAADDARQQTIGTTRLFAAGVESMLDRVSDIVSIAADHASQETDMANLHGRPKWPSTGLLAERLQQVQRLAFFDASGKGVCAKAACPDLSIADRPYFKKLQAAPDDRPSLYGPFDSKLDGQPVMIVAKGVRRDDGTFVGVVLAVLPTARLHDIAGNANLGPSSVASLRTASFDLIVRSPDLPSATDAGVNQRGPDILREAIASQPKEGVRVSKSPVDGQTRIAGYVKLRGYPVYAIVGSAQKDFTGGWVRTLPWMLGTLVVFALASLTIDRVARANRRLTDKATRLYDKAPCGYHTLDSQARFVHANAAALKWLGLSEAEVIGKLRPVDFMDDRTAAIFVKRYEELKVSGILRNVEFDLHGRDGVRRRVNVSAVAVRDDAGRFQSCNAVWTDVTELHEARQALREQARQQRAMLESDVVGMLLERDGRVVWQNEAMSGLFGFDSTQWSNLKLVDLWEHSDVHARWQASTEHSDAQAGKRKALYEFKRQDGSIFWGEMSQLSIAPNQSFVVISDVTYIRKAEESRNLAMRLEAQNLALQESARMKDEFLGNMSHELRTPLNGIMGFAHLICSSGSQDTGAAPTREQRFAGKIQECGSHLLELVNSMLEVARKKADSGTLSVELVTPLAALTEVAHMLEAKTEAAKVIVDISVEPGLEPVHADPLQLRQILLNLASNAIKFSPPGSQVNLHAFQESKDRWAVSVSDQGIGIAEGDLDRIFERFTQLSSGLTKQFQGLGMGLSLSRKLARAQGGDISVSSVLGRGSTFVLSLPNMPATPGSTSVASASTATTTTA